MMASNDTLHASNGHTLAAGRRLPSDDLPTGTPSVQVALNYSLPPPDGSEAYYDAYDSNKTNIDVEAVQCQVHDLRGYEDRANLDTHGFQFVHAGPSTEKLFTDDDQVKEGPYGREVEEMLLRHTGAKRVKIFDYTIRRQTWGKEGPLRRAPVSKAHVDQSAKAAEKRVRDNMGDEAEALLRGRFMLCNLWRPLLEGSPVQDKPLAFADYRTISDADFFPSKRLGNQHVGYTLGVKSNRQHKWYYLSEMRHEEAVIIKCYDNKPVVAVMTPHTAFTLPGEPPKGYLPRASIEARALLFF